MVYSRATSISAYQSAGTHGGVAAADPHGLILMLMNGALERLTRARGCIANKQYADKAQLIHSGVSIIDQLRNSLNLNDGGDVAANLDKLYEYMCKQLLNASIENDLTKLDEVSRLLLGIRDAWAQIPASQQRTSR